MTRPDHRHSPAREGFESEDVISVRRCAECGCWEYGGPPACAVCRGLVDGLVEEGWRGFLAREFGDAGPTPEEETALAEMIIDEPDRHDWRVVDAAMDRITCADCGSRLGHGPMGCHRCDLAHGFRYTAIETDRPDVPSGNEHALRVGVSVLRHPHRHSPLALVSWRLGLPAVIDGHLPTTREAQNLRHRLNKGATYDELAEEFDHMARPRRSIYHGQGTRRT